jgi:hydroxyacylglutathione hydrolase
MALRVECITVGVFQENCFLVRCTESGEGFVVDPGEEPERILGAVRASGAAIKAVLNTHAHLDHIGAVADVCEALDVPFLLHPDDTHLLGIAAQQAAMFGLPPPRQPVVDAPLREGERQALGRHALRVVHTPGHSPGHVCFYDGDRILLGGDLLFAGSVGRTDLPGGDFRLLERSIREKVYVLPDAVVVYPGHGPATTVGAEKASNPFVSI